MDKFEEFKEFVEKNTCRTTISRIGGYGLEVVTPREVVLKLIEEFENDRVHWEEVRNLTETLDEINSRKYDAKSIEVSKDPVMSCGSDFPLTHYQVGDYYRILIVDVEDE
jgi:hypothetical protein